MSDDDRQIALKALTLLDLTDLSDDCGPEAIKLLCARAVSPYGSVAAICIWPRFIGQARQQLAKSDVRIATVVNFPSGDSDTAAVVAATRQALKDGADEIDLVMNYRAFLAGQRSGVEKQIKDVKKAATGKGLLKVILETGMLKDAEVVGQASELAIAAGADFIKTSTGKVQINATLEAARIMLSVIKASGKKIGFKPAGGIRTLDDARAYLSLADEIMGNGWASPQTFRFGASGVLDALLAVLAGKPAAKTSKAY